MDKKERERTHACPYCKAYIKCGAVKCKHCGSCLASVIPLHEGICPYCKEEIDPGAVKCRHCQSDLLQTDCGCDKHSHDRCGDEPNMQRLMLDDRLRCFLHCLQYRSWPYCKAQCFGTMGRVGIHPVISS